MLKRSAVIVVGALLVAAVCTGCQSAGTAEPEASATQDEAQVEEPDNAEGSGSFDAEYTFDSQVNLDFGEEFSGEGFTAKLTGFDLMDEVQPANPDGYYVYMEKQDGMTYLVVQGEMTNTGTEAASIGSGSMVSISSPALVYTGDPMALGSGTIWAAPADGSSLGSFDVEPQATCPFLIIVPLTLEEAEDTSGYKVFFTVDSQFNSASFSTLGSDSVDVDAGGDYVYCVTL